MFETIVGYVFFGLIAAMLVGVLALPLVLELRNLFRRARWSGAVKLGALLAVALTLVVLLVSWQ